jgi:hypothetical protein
MDAPTDNAAVRSEILRRRWRQGSVLSVSLNDRVSMIPFAFPVPAGARFIVISQDCDVVNGNGVSEPAVEVVAGVPIEALDPARRHLKDPRELHIVLRDGQTDKFASASPWMRGFIPRSLLTQHDPDGTIQLAEEELSVLIDFIDRRYTRVALPDQFNKRFEAAKAALKEVLTPYVGEIVDLYVRISPFDELDPLPPRRTGKNEDDNAYELTIYVIVANQIVDHDRNRFQAIKNDLKTRIRALVRRRRGIHLDDVIVEGQDDINMRQMKEMRVLDFESFSLEVLDDSNDSSE